jgi:hypothetical protein
VFVLWILAVAEDSREAAADAAQIFRGDARVRQYWDERDGWSFSTTFRSVLGLGEQDPQRIVWDVYLLYRGRECWSGEPPTPTSWAYNGRGVFPPGVERIGTALVDRWFRDSANVA